ncbi:aryl-alcohol dehydrogenase-like predicted oxidoreductase [Paraburkholderia sp. WC7.3d]
MKYKQLGRTGLYVSELCLGTMTMGGNADAGMWTAIGALGQDEANQLIARALAEGINFIDTADIYSFGQSERLVGQALRDIGVPRSEIVLATKTAGVMGPKPNDQGASRGHIMDSVQRSLERLQVDHIDLYQIHASDPVTPIEETLRALDDLTRQGLVRYVGVSNWRAGKIGKALGLSEALHATRFETLQAYYSIAGRDVERELVPLVIEERMGLLVWSPLAGGLLSGKFGPGRQPNKVRGAAISIFRRSTLIGPGRALQRCAPWPTRAVSRSPGSRSPGCSPSRMSRASLSAPSGSNSSKIISARSMSSSPRMSLRVLKP